MKRIVLFFGFVMCMSIASAQVFIAPEKHKVVEEINGVTHIMYYAVLYNDVKVKTGVWKLKDKDGKVIQKIKYRNGEKIWIECPEENRYYLNEEVSI